MTLTCARTSPLAAMILLACASCGGDDDSTKATPDGSVFYPDAGQSVLVDGGLDGSVNLDASLTDDQQKAAIITGMHDSLLVELQNFKAATVELQAAAPTPTGRGWDATQDAAALAAMRLAWTKARTSYEHIEGALAPLFPDLDYTLDARYDNYLADPRSANDQYLFDDVGVTGLHGMERIMWAKETRQSVIDFEASLPGYKAAAFPATEQEAADFKNKLAAKAVTDVQSFIDMWTPAAIDLQQAFDGLISLMNEQHEKVSKAASNEEESRYSQTTMNDIRDNLAGTKTIYELFSPWLKTKPAAAIDGGSNASGVQTDKDIEAGFTALGVLYAATPGASVPAVPSDWAAEDPTPANLATPFGLLFRGVTEATSTVTDPSIVRSMNHAAALLGFPEFEEEE